jgi:hypothetical protein
MDELTCVFGTKAEAEAYAYGLRAGLGETNQGYIVEVTEQVTGEWQVTAEYLD